MAYYMNKVISGPFESGVERVVEALKTEGFGVLTDIDVQRTLMEKLGIDFRHYRIPGACNPPLAHHALETDDKIGTLLPCNIIVQEHADGTIEVAAVDPVVTMEKAGNPKLAQLAAEVRARLAKVIEKI